MVSRVHKVRQKKALWKRKIEKTILEMLFVTTAETHICAYNDVWTTYYQLYSNEDLQQFYRRDYNWHCPHSWLRILHCSCTVLGHELLE